MTPNELLDQVILAAESALTQRDTVRQENIDRAGRSRSRAPARVLLACMLAKAVDGALDPRKPYTDIGTPDSFSGRSYDERYITPLIHKYQLPCNTTTAFLTPGFRNFNRPLTKTVEPVGRPKELYTALYALLEEVASGNESPLALLTDAIRILIQVRNERAGTLQTLLAQMQQSKRPVLLSSEGIVRLIEQHLACRHSARLPVLLIAAAYDAVGTQLGEFRRPLLSHTAADEQTGSLGDVEVHLVNDEKVRTVYEMKSKPVALQDVDRAVHKIAHAEHRIENYIFVTTSPIDPIVHEYAKNQYLATGGSEIAVVDCVGFLRHFLHLFHRKRIEFLDAYHKLLLEEPDSAVSPALKQAFLALRLAAESES